MQIETTIKLHEVSVGHKKCEAFKEAAEKPPESSEAGRAMQSMTKSVYTKVAIMFRTCHEHSMEGHSLILNSSET